MSHTLTLGGTLAAQGWVTVVFEVQPGETAEEVTRLTGELALDLREVGETEYVPAASEDGAKGADAVAAATLAVLTASDPAYVQALVDTVIAFVRRHEGRRARLTVGDIGLAIDQPSTSEVAQMIDIVRSAIAARGVERADR
jgi:hypothetical protein